MPAFAIPLIIVGGVVLTIIALVALVAKHYIQVPPNKAGVFYGRKHGTGDDAKGYVVVTGGARLKIPIIEKYAEISMASFQLPVELRDIPNVDGVQVSVNAVATCKIKSDPASLNAAVERFLGQPREEILRTVRENLEGQLRSVVGTMTVEELLKDREKLNNMVKTEAASELDKIGVGIDILNIQSITDGEGYIAALGKKRTAEVQKDARIGEAEANRDAEIAATAAEKEGAIERAKNETLTAEAEKNRDVEQAKYDAMIQAETARAAQAGPLAQAEARKAVVAAEMAVEEERERAQIAVEEQKALVAAKREEANVVVPAKKAAEAAVAEAEGRRDAAIRAAEAQQKRLELEGAGEAAKIRAIGEGEAAKLKAAGEAEAEVIRAKLLAEAEGILKKNEAYAAMDDAAKVMFILEQAPELLRELPAIVSAAAAPLSAIDKVVVIENGGASGRSGVQQFASNAPGVLLGLVETAGELGFDLKRTLGKLGIDQSSIVDVPAATAESTDTNVDPAPDETSEEGDDVTPLGDGSDSAELDSDDLTELSQS